MVGLFNSGIGLELGRQSCQGTMNPQGKQTEVGPLQARSRYGATSPLPEKLETCDGEE